MSDDRTPALTTDDRIERRLLTRDERFERGLFWRQLAIVVLVAVLVALLILAA